MKKVLVLCFILVMSSYAFSAEQVNIGFVDLQRALNESEPGKKAKAELEALIIKRQGWIDEKINAKERFKEELQKQAVVLSDEELSKRQDELERMEREIDRMIEDSTAELQKKQREEELAILKELDAIITELGEKENLAVILPSEVVLYSRDGMDVTDLLIKRYNELKKDTEKQK